MELQPGDIGLPVPMDARRRARGLRREEVAALAAISPDYYARIEQGRRRAPWRTLDAIARALRLDPDARTYLFELADNADHPQRHRPQRVSEQLQRLLDGMTGLPAIVLGRRLDILAWNTAATDLVTDFGALPRHHRNYVRLTFTDPAMRTLYADWQQEARLCVAQLHMEAARDPRDPRLAELVGELSVLDPQFRRWWSDYQVAVRSRGVKHFCHPVVGELTLDWHTLTDADDPEQQLVYWSAGPGSASHQRMQKLAGMGPTH